MSGSPYDESRPDCGIGIQGAVWRALRLGGVPLGTPGALEVVQSLTWLVRQQPMILQRFPTDQNDRHTKEGFAPGEYWPEKLAKFARRIELLGLDNPQGRQALGEYTATLLGLMASVWRVYGPPPPDQYGPDCRINPKIE